MRVEIPYYNRISRTPLTIVYPYCLSVAIITVVSCHRSVLCYFSECDARNCDGIFVAYTADCSDLYSA